jgi:cytochrome d ubiquinol oxidase subunit II
VAAVTVSTFRIQPHVSERINGNPLSYTLPLLALGGIVGSRWFLGKGRELFAFLGSALFLAFMLVSVVFGLYPMVLPAAGDAAASLTIHNAAGPPYALSVALYWWIPGMILVTLYTTFMYRQMRGKVELDPDAY